MRLWPLALLLCACDDIQKTDQFTIEATTTVHLAAATAGDSALDTFPDLPALNPVDLSETEAFTTRGHDADDVATLRLGRLVLIATDPPGRDLSFLGQLRVYAEADGQDRRFMAQATAFPAGEKQVELGVADENLKGWLTGTAGRIVVVPVLSQRPIQATTLEFHFVFEVEVEVR